MLQMRLLGTHAAFKASREYFTTDRMTTEEFVPWLVTSEWDDRCNRTIERLIRQAGFRYQASVDHIDYSTERGIDCNLMQRLAGLGFLCLKGGTCSSPEARGLARAIWPQPWV